MKLKISIRINNTRKMKNKTRAIVIAPAAIPVKPNIAAMIATIKKTSAHHNIVISHAPVLEFYIRSLSECQYWNKN